MSDFYGTITASSFKYNRPVYYTNFLSIDQSDVIVKLVLNENNFNFSLAKTDGSDFRLVDSGGLGILHMWIAYWSSVRQKAVIFFKLPSIAAGADVVLQAYWGSPEAISIDNPTEVGFLFYESFNSSPLSSIKWSGFLTGTLTEDGYQLWEKSITTLGNPLASNSWVVELGAHCPTTYGGLNLAYNGTENEFFINVSRSGYIQHNIVQPAGEVTETVSQDYGGLIVDEDQDIYVDYYELTDSVTVNLSNRLNYSDVSYIMSRKVEGDTRLNSITLTGTSRIYVTWFIIRPWVGNYINLLDGTDLYIEHEIVTHETLSFAEYGLDFSDINYRHYANFGGEPTKLSDNNYESESSIYVSDIGATLEDYIYIDIHTGFGEDLTTKNYIHYDSSHINFYNASKLSDNDTDRMNRTYWECTTTSGWTAIKFPVFTEIGSFRIKAHSSSSNRPKNFILYGSAYNPYLFLDKAIEILSGTFINTSDWQFFKLDIPVTYKYYVLYIQDTYGGGNIKIQEWEFMAPIGIGSKRYVKQLRLLPPHFEDLDYNFPKEISLQGSNDGSTWDTILPWTETYTPFYKHYYHYGYWQMYTLDNNVGYWSYRLLCRGNWYAEDTRIIIGEWAFHELATEEYTFRILSGETNSIQQLWATEQCGLDDVHSTTFIANEKLNLVSFNKLIEYRDLPTLYEDFNVV